MPSGTTNSPRVGVCFDRNYPASLIVPFAQAAERAGAAAVWVVEDCFYTAGVSLAATALAATHEIEVGLGLLPVVARNPAITAMEIATLENLAPGRLVAGLGHGVQSWMGQIGARVPNPVAVLEATFDIVGRLLDGETVDFDDHGLHLTDVTLDQPPSRRPDLVAGVRGPKSLAAAGRVADGILFAEGDGPVSMTSALQIIDPPDDFRVDLYALFSVADARRDAYSAVAERIATYVTDRNPALIGLDFFDDMAAHVERGAAAALIDMPADYWAQLGAIGTRDDIGAFVEACGAVGVGSVNLFPQPTPQAGMDLIAFLADWMPTRG